MMTAKKTYKNDVIKEATEIIIKLVDVFNVKLM